VVCNVDMDVWCVLFTCEVLHCGVHAAWWNLIFDPRHPSPILELFLAARGPCPPVIVQATTFSLFCYFLVA